MNKTIEKRVVHYEQNSVSEVDYYRIMACYPDTLVIPPSPQYGEFVKLAIGNIGAEYKYIIEHCLLYAQNDEEMLQHIVEEYAEDCASITMNVRYGLDNPNASTYSDIYNPLVRSISQAVLGMVSFIGSYILEMKIPYFGVKVPYVFHTQLNDGTNVFTKAKYCLIINS